MKKTYRLGGDLFVAGAFISFIVGGVFKIFSEIGLNCNLGVIGWEGLFKLTVVFLLFSIALSLLDVVHEEENAD